MWHPQTRDQIVADIDDAVEALTELRRKYLDPNARPLSRNDTHAAITALRAAANAIASDTLTEAAREPNTVLENLALLDELGMALRSGTSPDPIDRAVSEAINGTVADAIQRRLVDIARQEYMATAGS